MTTLPKNHGLSLLADVANLDRDIVHYPVKRKGQPRALLPNREAIAWLEADKASTEIETTSEEGGDTGLVYTFAVGRYEKTYARPMFQIIHDEAFSSFRGITAAACPCGDFSRTAYCDEHGELDFDWDRKQWIRPGTSLWYTHHPEDRAPRADRRPDGQPTLYVEQSVAEEIRAAGPPEGLYDRMVEMFARPQYSWTPEQQLMAGTFRPCSDPACGLCAPFRRADPNAGRPGYHYDALTDRWLADTSDPIGDFRAGAPVGPLESNPENRPGTSGRVPDTERWIDRVLGLQSATIRIEGVFDEGIVTFETEENAGGDTRTT